MATYNEKYKVIMAMIEMGHSILEVEISDYSRWFIAKTFEPPVGGSVSAAPYFKLHGWDCTEFIVGNIYSEGMRENFKIQLVAKDRDITCHDYQFSDNHVWRYYE